MSAVGMYVRPSSATPSFLIALILVGTLCPTCAGQALPELFAIQQGGTHVTFSPDGELVAGSISGKSWRATDLRVCRVATGAEVMAPGGHASGIWQINFSRDGRRLATNDNYTAKVWELESASEICSIKMPAFTRSVVFVGDGNQIATGHDDGRIRLWDLGTSKLARVLKGHTDWVPGLACSQDGRYLASGSVDCQAKLWDLSTGKVTQSFVGHEWYLNCVALDPLGRRLLSGSDDLTARIWSLETGKHQLTLRGHKDFVRSVAFGPRSQLVATASRDNTAKVWDATTGEQLAAIEQSGSITCVAFSPDGTRLATASDEQEIKFWDLAGLR